jgi:hypothetical protein
MTAYRKVEIGNPRHLSPCNPTLSPRGARPGLAHDVCEGVPMSVQLDVGSGHVIYRIAVILVPEERLPVSNGIDLDLRIIDSQVMTDAIERALVGNREPE